MRKKKTPKEVRKSIERQKRLGEESRAKKTAKVKKSVERQRSKKKQKEAGTLKQGRPTPETIVLKEKEKLLPSGLTKEEGTRQAEAAFKKPFTDPVGFAKDVVNPSNLIETLPLAIGAGFSGAGGAVAGEAVAGEAAAGAVIKVSPKVIQGIRTRLALTKFGQGGGTRVIPGQEILHTGKNAVLKNTFKTNSKTQGLTQSMFGKIGLTIPSASILLGAIGSYPFAGFIKEEALQTLSFGTKVAIDSGDLDGAQASIDQINEVLNPTAIEKLIGTIPYVNVVKQLLDFFEAAATKNTADQKALDKKRKIAEGEIESDFARERRVSDEAAFERKREFGEEESARFEGIREEGEARDAEAAERKTADREAESQRFEQIEADRTAAANEEKRLNSIYFQLLRDKKFDEAEEFRITNFPT